jgi:sugar phosphate isomerase/epimerase
MKRYSRSEFLKAAVGAGAMLYGRRFAPANPLGLPLGLQPYTVRNQLKDDFEGTLKKVIAMGYQEIEVSGGEGFGDFNGYKAKELHQILDGLGLRTPSCHYGAPKDDAGWARNIEDARTLGLQYMLSTTRPEWQKSLDGWKKTGDFFNHLGTMCRNAGMQLCYHNHNFEFRVYDGVIAYDQLLSSSDKELVKMELDCFWITFAGKDPVDYFHRHLGRFPLLHIKDLKPGYKPTTASPEGNPFTEVGSGVIDWKRIFKAAPDAGVKHYYVEQDNWDRSPLECARISADYLKKLKV